MECEHPTPDGRLRQGDIFAGQPGSENWNDPWRRFGVILTADCDLEKGKGGPNLVYVPIVGLRTYLADVWLPAQAHKLYEETTNTLDKVLSEIRGSQLKARHVERMTKDELSGALASITTVKDGELEEKIETISNLKQARAELDKIQFPQQPSRLSELTTILNKFFSQQEIISRPSNPGTAHRRKSVFDSLCDLDKDNRVDTWPITDLVDLDPEMREDEHFGFVIDLRRFSVVPTNQVLTERKVWWNCPDCYLRVCRLGEIYKSDLLQKFSHMFVRVGLEDSRKDNHRHIFHRLAQKVIPDAGL